MGYYYRALTAAFVSNAAEARNGDGSVRDLPRLIQFRTNRIKGILITLPFATFCIADQAPNVVWML